MLCGEYCHVVDAKNRMFVPSKLRDVLGQTFVITKAIRQNCLTVYSLEGWEAYIKPIKDQERKLAEKALRYLHAPLIMVTPDAQGRVVLTQELKKFAGIDKNVVIVGCFAYAEIWAEENYSRADDNDEDREEMVADLERFGL